MAEEQAWGVGRKANRLRIPWPLECRLLTPTISIFPTLTSIPESSISPTYTLSLITINALKTSIWVFVYYSNIFRSQQLPDFFPNPIPSQDWIGLHLKRHYILPCAIANTFILLAQSHRLHFELRKLQLKKIAMINHNCHFQQGFSFFITDQRATNWVNCPPL